MTNDDLAAAVQRLTDAVHTSFWSKPDFWLFLALGFASLLLGAGSIYFSWAAFVQARKAERAAREAARTVKIHVDTIDLTEIPQKLDKLHPNIHFDDARKLLAEITRRLRRIITPFQKDAALADTVTGLQQALDGAKAALQSVKPTDAASESEAPQAVYNSIEGPFTTIDALVADLSGLLEKKTMNFGDDNGDV
jgi:hypothetical protein